ncbi:hypothetical protein [Ornithinimicrobium sufpigmenti]|uniref:hypothetical protein n=1 Tax=Ornithinimicrobium sufpigmenti TaxID=2508882 RepID=UPI0010364CA4|nr:MULTISPECIES: hypothetical protein [unclassified Ornithinimicrobium]
MKTRALFLAGGLALTMSLAACGNDDEAQAAEAISESMMEQTDDEFPVEQEQADCVGEGMVDQIGVEKLQEYGLITDDMEVDGEVTDVTMEEADADSAADVFVNCVDAQALLAEEFAADDTMGEQEQECINEVLDNDALAEVFSLMFQGREDEAGNSLIEPLMECMMG